MARIKTDKKINPLVAWTLIVGFSVGVILGMRIHDNMYFNASSQIIEQIISAKIGGEVTVVLDYGNGKIRKFRGPIEEKAKALDLLQQVVAIGAIELEVADYFMPQRINGNKNGDGDKKWNIYVNSVKRERSPFEIYVLPGDEITFKFE